MKKTMVSGVLMGAALGLSACASGLSQDDCLYADWRAIGYEDGARGYAADAVSAYRKSCVKKAGVVPDMDAYLAGREAGLQHYCVASNGFAEGARGAVFRGVCTGPKASVFALAYQRGAALYMFERGVTKTAAAYAAAETELADIGLAIADAEAALISPATPHLARAEILVDLKGLNERRAYLEQSLQPLADDHAAAKIALEDYRVFLASGGVDGDAGDFNVVDEDRRGVIGVTRARY